MSVSLSFCLWYACVSQVGGRGGGHLSNVVSDLVQTMYTDVLQFTHTMVMVISVQPGAGWGGESSTDEVGPGSKPIIVPKSTVSMYSTMNTRKMKGSLDLGLI